MFEINQTLRVLIVDPSSSDRGQLKQSLQLLGIKDIELAQSGIEATVMLDRGKPFDLVITEYHMTPMDGEDLLQFMKESVKYSEIPVMMTSNENRKDIVVRIVDSGIADYLIKPILVEDIRLRVGQIIAKRLNTFIQQLRTFSNGAEFQLEIEDKNETRDEKILTIFEEKMGLIRECSKQLKLPHIAKISALAKEVASKAHLSKTKKMRKVTASLWDAITTIKTLFETPNSQQMEENGIITNRLEKTLRSLKISQVDDLSDAEIEAIIFEKMVKDLIEE